MIIRDPVRTYRAVWGIAVTVLLIGLGAATLVSLARSPSLLGAGVLASVLVLTLCSPVALRAVRHGWRSVHRPSTPRLETLVRAFSYANPSFVTLPTPLLGPSELSDEQLAQDWQATSRLLRARTTSAEQTAIVEERQTYLEEFERRNPSGFAAWLTSSAASTDDLMPYLRQPGCENAVINWDELTGGRDC